MAEMTLGSSKMGSHDERYRLSWRVGRCEIEVVIYAAFNMYSELFCRDIPSIA